MITYLLTPWFYGLPRALAPLIMDAHSSLSTAFCYQVWTFICHRSFSTSSSHLSLGLPLLLCSGLFSYTLTVLPWSFLTTCPIHSNNLLLISATIHRSLYSFLNFWLVLILHIPCSTTGPRILNTVKPVLNGISRDQDIFPLKPGFRLIKVHYIEYKKLNQDMQTLTLRWLMSYIYGAPILDVSRSHTTTQHSR